MCMYTWSQSEESMQTCREECAIDDTKQGLIWVYIYPQGPREKKKKKTMDRSDVNEPWGAVIKKEEKDDRYHDDKHGPHLIRL